ncbi:MAG: hypothetical protein FD156_29 [Nitrospirae bacterium]|nr:MAG: hypothetical protein FD156_29 [Nitrospirota bacterium]
MRIIALIDILGFRDIIAETTDGKGNDKEKDIEKTYYIFSTIRKILDLDNPEGFFEKSKVVTQFSDSIVISFLYSEESGIFYNLFDIQVLISELLKHKVLCRGGITLGKLIHTDKILFGPGFIKAYDTESKAALFPRVILDETILDIGKQFHSFHHAPEDELDSINSIVSKDTDNMYYIDYFGKAFENLDSAEDEPLYIENLREIITPYINTDKPDLKVKYGWLINKFNRMVDEIKEYRSSKDFDESDYDLEQYYKQLTLIKS